MALKIQVSRRWCNKHERIVSDSLEKKFTNSKFLNRFEYQFKFLKIWIVLNLVENPIEISATDMKKLIFDSKQIQIYKIKLQSTILDFASQRRQRYNVFLPNRTMHYIYSIIVPFGFPLILEHD